MVSGTHAPRLRSHCEPGMELRSRRLFLGERPLLHWNTFDVAPGQRPDRIIARNRSRNEVLDLAAGFVVGPQPETYPGSIAGDRPLQRRTSELDIWTSALHPTRDRLPTGPQVVVCIRDDADDFPVGRLELESNCITQRLVAVLVQDFEGRRRFKALPIEISNDVLVVLTFDEENTCGLVRWKGRCSAGHGLISPRYRSAPR